MIIVQTGLILALLSLCSNVPFVSPNTGTLLLGLNRANISLIWVIINKTYTDIISDACSHTFVLYEKEWKPYRQGWHMPRVDSYLFLIIATIFTISYTMLQLWGSIYALHSKDVCSLKLHLKGQMGSCRIMEGRRDDKKK